MLSWVDVDGAQNKDKSLAKFCQWAIRCVNECESEC